MSSETVTCERQASDEINIHRHHFKITDDHLESAMTTAVSSKRDPLNTTTTIALTTTTKQSNKVCSPIKVWIDENDIDRLRVGV